MTVSKNIYAKRGSGTISKDGYLLTYQSGKQRPAHLAIVEAAFGRALPAGAEIHHWNENKKDNTPANLLLCPDHAYHMLMHRRSRALDACGNANWLKCPFCKEYDAPLNMKIAKRVRGSVREVWFHLACKVNYNRAHVRKGEP